jgi:hypothetical protein
MTTHDCLFRRLYDDTTNPARDRVAVPRLARWADTESALSGPVTPAGMVSMLLDKEDRPRANQAFAALVRVATDDAFARRLALAALAPGLAAIAHAQARRWQADPAEVDQMAGLVALKLLQDGEQAEGAARWLLGRVEGRLRWWLDGEHRRHRPSPPVPPDLTEPGVALDEVVAERLDAQALLDRALRAGRVSRLGAWVVTETRAADRPVTELAVELGRTPGSVRVLRARTELALGEAS